MKFLITSSVETGRVDQILWKEGDIVVSKTLYRDGTQEKRTTYHATLFDAAGEMGNGYSSSRLVDVADVRSAEKYLGKSSDLVNALPEQDIYAPDEPSINAS
jgi:3-mercaptopyruvate sulfurtransferase SseA